MNTILPSFNVSAEILTTTASMFARQFVKVAPGNPQTDGQYVYLPGIKERVNARELEILRGYFIHECAHLRYQSLSHTVKRTLGRWQDRLSRAGVDGNLIWSFYNATEDARIEAKARHELRGARGPLDAINRQCEADNNSRGDTGMPLHQQVSHALLHWLQHSLDRATYIPAGRAVFEDLDLPQHLVEYRDGLNHGKWTASRAAGEAGKFLLLLKDYLDNQQPDIPDPPDQPGESGESGDSGQPDGDDGDTGDGNGTSSTDTDGTGTDDGDSGGDDGDSGDSGGESDISGGGSGDYSLPEPGECDDYGISSTYGDQADDLKAQNGEPRAELSRHGAYCEEVDPANDDGTSGGSNLHGHDYAEIHSAAMRLTNSLRRHLKCDDNIHWTSPMESGHRIDRRRLSGVATDTSTRAFNRRRIDDAEKTQVSIVIDRSSSMDSVYGRVVRASYAVADACECLRIPTGVVTFSSGSQVAKIPGKRISTSIKWPYYCGGCTNMLPALQQVGVWRDSAPDRRHVAFLFSDGATGYSDLCCEMIKGLHDRGVDWIGVDIGNGMSAEIRDAITDTGGKYYAMCHRTTQDEVTAEMDRMLRAR